MSDDREFLRDRGVGPVGDRQPPRDDVTFSITATDGHPDDKLEPMVLTHAEAVAWVSAQLSDEEDGATLHLAITTSKRAPAPPSTELES